MLIINVKVVLIFTGTEGGQNLNSYESVDDFEQRIFSDRAERVEKDGHEGLPSLRFFKKLDRAEKAAHGGLGMGNSFDGGNRSGFMDSLGGGESTLMDGMDHKLKKAATYFEFDPAEVTKEDYAFRPDVNFSTGGTYDTKVLPRYSLSCINHCRR